MDTALALLLPLIGGFLFVKDANYIKYEVAREDGHRFYLRVSYYGLFFFILSSVVFLFLLWIRQWVPLLDEVHKLLVSIVGPMLKVQSGTQGQVNFLFICLFSVFLGRITPPIVNSLLRKTAEEAVKEAARKDELEDLLVDAITEQKTISVTMSSGKVYVGLPIGTAEPRAARKAIAILPLISGYRDDEKEVRFTTHYDRAFDPNNFNEAGDFRLVLPADKIVSAAFFDIQVYEKFKKMSATVEDALNSKPSALSALGMLFIIAADKGFGPAIASLFGAQRKDRP